MSPKKIFLIPCWSLGLYKLKFFIKFIYSEYTFLPLYFMLNKGADGISILGWGRKKSGLRAIALAKKYSLNYLLLEEGFLRSYSSHKPSPPLSLIFDNQGFYYDCSKISCIERLLNANISNIISDLSLIKSIQSELISQRLSKYNDAILDEKTLFNIKKKAVLVIDQIHDDLSVRYGDVNHETFSEMLEASLRENPTSTVYIKIHPVSLLEGKKGFLNHWESHPRVVIIKGNINPIQLIQKMDRVYVMTSQMGFEALMCGKPVTCFGVPWYAGWGLTDDRVKASTAWERRTKKRTVEELFYAAYIKYTRYLNPITHQRGKLLDVIHWLVHQKKINEHFFPGYEKGINHGRIIAYGFKKWKAFNVKPFFSLHPDRVFLVSHVKALHRLLLQENDRIVCWGNQLPVELLKTAQENKNSILYAEDGFIRSVGLGSDLIRPLSLVFDKKGIYFDARKASNLEVILNKNDFTIEELKNASKIKNMIIQNQITKYNIDHDIKPQWKTSTQKIILVPGQVEDDASIQFGSFWIRTNLSLLQEVRSRNPKAYIVYKPHPDTIFNRRMGKVSDENALLYADHIERKASVIRSIEASDEIHTMTSQVGFDALIRGKRVITYGEPFYAGWGLTIDLYKLGKSFKRRKKKLTLLELIAGTLIRYPIYWDYELEGYTTCEATILRIIERKKNLIDTNQFDKLSAGWLRRQFRKINTLRQVYFPISEL